MNRRAVLAGGLALVGCSRATADAVTPPLPPLKSAAPFPLGVAAMTEQFDDPVWNQLVSTHFERVTPEWEMKAEAVAGAGEGFEWTRPDRLVSRAADRNLRVFGHTLVWYSQVPPRFGALDGDRSRFAKAYRDYVTAVAGRYVGRVVGWDVVNEAVTDDGSGYRTGHAWERNLGMDYVRLAFEHARAADPAAVLFLNDYNLEQLPGKRADFLRLAEGLLQAGAPLGGLGTQTHVPADLPAGSIARTVRELAALGLPVHVSELDVSINRAGRFTPRGELEASQARIVRETVEAVLGLPSHQRFGITLWGARDGDSWLNRPPEKSPLRADAPLLFDDAGRAKAMARAMVAALA